MAGCAPITFAARCLNDSVTEAELLPHEDVTEIIEEWICVKGGAILCHGAEQRRTTGRSVFSMSVTLRWASAEDLSGIERGAV